MVCYLVILLLLVAGVSCEEIEHTKPSLVLFSIDSCDECAKLHSLWTELEAAVESDDILIDQINCNYHEDACSHHRVTIFPSILFISTKGIREFDMEEEMYSVDNLLHFIDTSIAVIINEEDLLTEDEQNLIFLKEEDLDILGKTHSLVYFMYDEEVEIVEEFVIKLREHLAEEFSLPVYVVPCGDLTNICVKEPFMVKSLPCIKYLGEKIVSYEEDIFTVEKIEKWLQVKVFKTIGEVGQAAHIHREEEDDENLEIDYEDDDYKPVPAANPAVNAAESDTLHSQPVSDEADEGCSATSTDQDTGDCSGNGDLENDKEELMFLNKDNFQSTIKQYGAVIVAFLNKDSTRLEKIFRELSESHSTTTDLLICAVQCEDNAYLCSGLDAIPTVKHGFNGNLVREVNFRTKDSLNKHIESIKLVLINGKDILKRSADKVYELTIVNFGEEIYKFDVTFVYFYTTGCGKCDECNKVWSKIHEIYALHPLVLPARVDCNFNRGTCKQGQAKANQVNVYYKGVYHSKFPGKIEYTSLAKFLHQMYRYPPKGVFERSPEDIPKIDKDKETEDKKTQDKKTQDKKPEDNKTHDKIIEDKITEDKLTEDTTVEEEVKMVEKRDVGEKEVENTEQETSEEEKVGHVVIITSDNYNSTLAKNRLVFIKFFVPWCGHCQKLKPTWKLLGNSFKSVTDIVIGMLNCQNERELCKKHLVSSYPTLFVFINGEQTYRYRETRALNNFIEFVKKKYYLSIDDDLKYNSEPFPLTPSNIWNVLGTRRYTVSLFIAKDCLYCTTQLRYLTMGWESVKKNEELSAKVMLSTVDCDKYLDLCVDLNVPRIPYMKIHDITEEVKDDLHAVKFLMPFRKLQQGINNALERSFDISALKNKLEKTKEKGITQQRKEERNPDKNDIGDKTTEPQTAQAKVEPVVVITKDHFEAVLKESRFTFIKFYTPWCGHCRKLAPVWEKLGKEFVEEPAVVMGKVDCDREEALCDQFGVETYPTLFMFENDLKLKHKYKKPRKEDALRTYIEEFIGKPPVAKESTPEAKILDVKETKPPKPEAISHLGEDNFKSTLKLSRFTFVKFYAPWCGHCRKLAPVWDKLSDELINEHDIIMAKVNCDTEEKLCDKFNVATYPSLIMFENDKKLKHKCKRRKEADLKTYIQKFLDKPSPEVTVPKTVTGPSPPVEKNLNKINKGVLNLNLESLKQYNSATSHVFVMFFISDCPKCTNLSPTWDRLADLYIEETGIILGRVNCVKETTLCNSYQVTTYPTLLMFDNEHDKLHVCRKRAEYDLTGYIDSFLDVKRSAKDEL